MTTTAFRLESPAFANGAAIPVLHTAQGLDLSPPLRWQGEPGATSSYALVVDDPDAPRGPWVHWILFNIPRDLHGLPTGLQRQAELANGARHGGCWGVQSFERLGYQGPQPPPGPSHRYRFVLHALDTRLPLHPGSTLKELQRAMEGHVLAKAELTGRFGADSAEQH
ncbi:MAG: YbhB/YbcL family Raf kinase inhibitor-like protein [Synechococcaceae bacterium WB9_2_112]|nr:YbhB/YbcL family Raf kinase inhibitor-like protein [Synechococcaceae bacterium WB9_2_112]